MIVGLGSWGKSRGRDLLKDKGKRMKDKLGGERGGIPDLGFRRLRSGFGVFHDTNEYAFHFTRFLLNSH